MILDGEQGPDGFVEGSVRLNARSEAGNFPLHGRCGWEERTWWRPLA